MEVKQLFYLVFNINYNRDNFLWSGLVCRKYLEWDEAVITSFATNKQQTTNNNKQLPNYRASPDFLLDLLDFIKSGDLYIPRDTPGHYLHILMGIL